MKKKKIGVIGGGAAGFFFAINVLENRNDIAVDILEKSPKLLEKVRISGGGRCNVTHACFDPKLLVKNYPRGEKELISPFFQFQPKQLIEWFENKGVQIKTEADGRMFPTTDDSSTIVDCLYNSAKSAGVNIMTLCGVDEIKHINDIWIVKTNTGKTLQYDALFISTGSAARMWDMLSSLGHSIAPPVPSLFTFKIKDPRLEDLMGVSVPVAEVSIPILKLKERGAVLITHWGLSGPAILRLSAWGARELASVNHQGNIVINWTGNFTKNKVLEELKTEKIQHPKKLVISSKSFDIPSRLWVSLCRYAEIDETLIFADVTHKKLDILADALTQSSFQILGKSTNKDEFVTAGGVSLKEVDMKTMQSKLYKNLFFGGEVLNVDAITGGFNFQAAWTTSWIAATQLNL
jgi:predicted Rossmann fold flavoprotein